MSGQEEAWATGCAQGTRDITIRAWVFNARGLGLRPGSCAAVLLSRIWEVTHDGVGVYRQTKSSFSKEFGFDRKTVKSAFDELSRRRLILPAGTYFYRGHDIPMWVVNDRAADKAAADVLGADRAAYLAATAAAEAAAQGEAKEAEARLTWPAVGEGAPYDEVDASFDEFAASYPRPDATAEARAKARAAWRKLMEEGHTPEELGCALASYLEIHSRRNAGRAPFSPEWMKYFKYLSRFLSDDGSENWRWALAQAKTGNLSARRQPTAGVTVGAHAPKPAACGPWAVSAPATNGGDVPTARKRVEAAPPATPCEGDVGGEKTAAAEPSARPDDAAHADEAAPAATQGSCVPVRPVSPTMSTADMGGDAVRGAVASPGEPPAEASQGTRAETAAGAGPQAQVAPPAAGAIAAQEGDRVARTAEAAAACARLNRVNDGRSVYWAAYTMVDGQMKSYELPACGSCKREEAREYLRGVIEGDLRSLEAWRNK